MRTGVSLFLLLLPLLPGFLAFSLYISSSSQEPYVILLEAEGEGRCWGISLRYSVCIPRVTLTILAALSSPMLLPSSPLHLLPYRYSRTCSYSWFPPGTVTYL